MLCTRTVHISPTQLIRCLHRSKLLSQTPHRRFQLCASTTKASFSTSTPPPESSRSLSNLDQYLTSQLTSHYKSTSCCKPSICSYTQYRQNANLVLDEVLPSESVPLPDRRADTPPQADEIGDGLVLVIHATEIQGEIRYTSCSGFVISTVNPSGRMVVTCAHTLEEIEYRYPFTPKRTFILFPSYPIGTETTENTKPSLIPISSIPTSLPRADKLILRLPDSIPPHLRSLPITPYPLSRDHEVLVHCFGSPDPPIPRISVSRSEGKIEQQEAISWPEGMGWRRWVKGRLLGYRGDLWEEVEAGTADSLPYILTSPLPSPGSSGGPIVDARSGAVIGVISGTRMDNRIEGERGWGASAENVFELFSLPGFTPASKRSKS